MASRHAGRNLLQNSRQRNPARQEKTLLRKFNDFCLYNPVFYIKIRMKLIILYQYALHDKRRIWLWHMQSVMLV